MDCPVGPVQLGWAMRGVSQRVIEMVRESWENGRMVTVEVLEVVIWAS